jgi:hypothetical protein
MSTKIQNYIPLSLYYVYVLIDPCTNLPFYVGKGKNNRVITHYWNQSESINPHKVRKIKKLKKQGFKPKWEIVFESADEKEVYNKEKELIAKWGRLHIDKKGILTNISPGGKNPYSNTKDNPNLRAVDQYDMFGNYIQTFSSNKEAAQWCGGKNSATNISVCCTKSSKTARSAHGFLWAHHGTALDLDWCVGQSRRNIVYQWTLLGEFVGKHARLTDAALSIGPKASTSSIRVAIKTKRSAYNFQWTLSDQAPASYKKLNYKTFKECGRG